MTNIITMKIRHCITLLTLFLLLSPLCRAAEPGMTLGDTLMADTSFVLKGAMSKKWNGMVEFAVTDPVKNRGHELHAGKNGRFEMTVPMRGPVQDIYLYIGGTVTIPVCAGDTINMILEDDDMRLYARDPKAELDLRLAEVVHNKMRKRYIDINRTVNDYLAKSSYGNKATAESDSLIADVIRKIDDYRQRYITVVDTFIANHGAPRMEEYFRLSGCYGPLKFMTWNGLAENLPKVGVTENYNGKPYNFFCEPWMKYPAYRDFLFGYLICMTDRASRAFLFKGESDRFVRAFDLSRAISPDRFLEELSEVRSIRSQAKHRNGGLLVQQMMYVYNYLNNTALRNEMEGLMADIDRLAPGSPAPKLVLKDCDGKKFTLDDFRGRYVYLDFWDFGCGPCISEFKMIPKLREHFAGHMDKVEIVTVCASEPSKSKLEKFVEKHDMNERNLILDKRQSDKIYDVDSYPTYMLIDPEGRIVEFYTDRPSVILFKANAGIATAFEKALSPK